MPRNCEQKRSPKSVDFAIELFCEVFLFTFFGCQNAFFEFQFLYFDKKEKSAPKLKKNREEMSEGLSAMEGELDEESKAAEELSDIEIEDDGGSDDDDAQDKVEKHKAKRKMRRLMGTHLPKDPLESAAMVEKIKSLKEVQIEISA